MRLTERRHTGTDYAAFPVKETWKQLELNGPLVVTDAEYLAKMVEKLCQYEEREAGWDAAPEGQKG